MQPARLAVDIGGTFTDLALEYQDRRFTLKTLTTPAAPERGVMEGVAAILGEAGLTADAVGIVIHGTTLATNALIERKGAKTALLTTEGFRDVLAMRNESRYDQYDLNIVLPEPLVPRDLRLPVSERLDRAGRVLRPLDEGAVRALTDVLRAKSVESVAVGFLHAFVNPAHEQRVRDILHDSLPDLPISLSSEVSPEMREWERFSTTAANAYVQPAIAGYLRRLETSLRQSGLSAPLFLMLSGGGLTTLDIACRFPIRLVESGPAGGAIFAAHVARQAGAERVLSFDMGGTTAKVCLIDDYSPQTARSFEVARIGRFKKGSGLPVRIPVIEMVEIGAGGGSTARLDSMKRITVGPDSAGADPGPACYGRRGAQPTVTDANLLLGRYDPAHFAGGAIALNETAARDAIARAVGAELQLQPQLAALGVVEVVDENMANAARVHAAESGASNQGRTLIAFGGGGPVHACRVAEKVGIARILVPPNAGVGSAVGFLRAPVSYEVVRSLHQRLSSLNVEAVNQLTTDMQREAAAIVAQGGGAATQESRIAYMRYVGQGHEIPVSLPARPLAEVDISALRRAYDAEYARFYDRPVPRAEVEIMSFAVRAATAPHEDVATSRARLPAPGAARAAGVRDVLDTATGEVAPWAVHERASLDVGANIAGPAIIAEDETSTLVGPGWVAGVDAHFCLVLTRSAAR